MVVDDVDECAPGTLAGHVLSVEETPGPHLPCHLDVLW